MLHRQVPETQAVVQPIGQEAVHLNLFIRVMHEPVRIVIHGRNLSLPVAADYFGHEGIVVYAHSHPRVVQPSAAVVDLLQQQGFGESGRLKHFNPHPAQVLVLPVKFELTYGLAVSLKLAQLAQALIVAVAECSQLAQIRHILPGPLYPLPHACHSRRKRSLFNCSHWMAIIAAALLMRPSAIMAKHSSADTTWLRMSSCSCSIPKTPPASAVLILPQYRWIISVVPPGETR